MRNFATPVDALPVQKEYAFEVRLTEAALLVGAKLKLSHAGRCFQLEIRRRCDPRGGNGLQEYEGS